MQISDLVRADIKNMEPYEPHLYSNVIRLDANENPHLFPPEVMEEICSQLTQDDFTRYPNPLAQELKASLGKMNGVAPENILVGNGSDELILLILQTFGGPGKRVVIPVPTFSMYKIHGLISGTEPVEVPRNDDFSINEELLIKEMQHPDTRVTFIATPNNPTGNITPAEQIKRLAKATNSLVVVDEAYINFGGSTNLELLKEFPNLIILRTFSKVALAGLRVGYLLANRAVTTELLKVKQPYNVNNFSQIAALMVLKNWSKFKAQVEEIKAERARLETELNNIPGVSVFPSQANFILFKVQVSPDEVYKKLLERGILIRKGFGRTHGLEYCLRVTVGRQEENDSFLENLKKILIP